MVKLKKERIKEYEKKIQQAIDILKQISQDARTPRNIKKVVCSVIKELGKEKLSLAMKTSNAISMLNEVSQDPNLPSYLRTSIYYILSLIENIRN